MNTLLQLTYSSRTSADLLPLQHGDALLHVAVGHFHRNFMIGIDYWLFHTLSGAGLNASM
jgi:hypothetical protein